MIQADQTHKNALFYLAFTVPANLAEKTKNSSFLFSVFLLPRLESFRNMKSS